jgi:DNA-directed RNA polymerase subunit H
VAKGSNPFRPADIVRESVGGWIAISQTGKIQYNILNHELVPEHTVLSEKEQNEFIKKYNIQPDQLPKIMNTDPAAIAIGAKPGQIVKIIRQSQTAKYATVYRFVIESESESKIRMDSLPMESEVTDEEED